MILSSEVRAAGESLPPISDPVVSPLRKRPQRPMIGTPVAQAKPDVQSVTRFDPEYRQVILFAVTRGGSDERKRRPDRHAEEGAQGPGCDLRRRGPCPGHERSERQAHVLAQGLHAEAARPGPRFRRPRAFGADPFAGAARSPDVAAHAAG